jgi:hypothetical protein
MDSLSPGLHLASGGQWGVSAGSERMGAPRLHLASGARERGRGDGRAVQDDGGASSWRQDK